MPATSDLIATAQPAPLDTLPAHPFDLEPHSSQPVVAQLATVSLGISNGGSADPTGPTYTPGQSGTVSSSQGPKTVSSSVQVVSRPVCLEPGCQSTQVAQDCRYRRCKKHCVQQGTPCGYRAHNAARNAIPVTSRQGSAGTATLDPFALVPPSPVVPPRPLPTPLHGDSQRPGPAGSSRATENLALLTDWDARAKANLEKRQVEEQLHKNRALIDHAIVLHAWLENGHPPKTYNIQGVEPWPTFKATSQASILTGLALRSTNVWERYDIPSRTWRTKNVDTAFVVSKDEHVFVKFQGILNCEGLEELVRHYLEQQSWRGGKFGTTSAAFAGSLSPSPRKLSLHTSYIPPTTAFSQASYAVHVPSSSLALSPATSPPCSSSPSSSGSSTPEPPHPPLFDLPPPSNAWGLGLHFPAHNAQATSDSATDFDFDQLWAQGVVYTPPSFDSSKPWPYGIYARDMVKAFAMIGDDKDKEKVGARFSFVFQGRKFKHATYYSQRSAWLESSEAERMTVAQMPREKAALWTNIRKRLSGWRAQPRHS
ncbi:hypothetical protein LXA43DRAFT_905179 [Ganoderma leucocontextum]|nr:hypothetical protein LXA43DRAFT_905179 [Ganoderma leucocontextum]